MDEFKRESLKLACQVYKSPATTSQVQDANKIVDMARVFEIYLRTVDLVKTLDKPRKTDLAQK